MFSAQQNEFEIDAAESTIFQVLDDLSTSRVLILHNKGAYTLTCQYQYSTDGGTTWTSLAAAFSLGASGSGNEVDALEITQSGRIRLLASGGGGDRDLSVLVVRVSTSVSTAGTNLPRPSASGGRANWIGPSSVRR